VIIIFNGQIFAKVNYSNQKITSPVLSLPQIPHRKKVFTSTNKKQIQTVSFYRTVLSIPFEEFLLLFYFGMG
jgi:hypothetical protein